MPDLSNGAEFVELITTNKGEINGCSTSGDTPLTIACWWKNVPIVDVLLELGADVHPRGEKIVLVKDKLISSLFMSKGGGKVAMSYHCYLLPLL